MDQSSRDHTLLDVRPSPGPGRGAVSWQSSRDKHRKHSLPGSTVRKEGRAISTMRWSDVQSKHADRIGEDEVERGKARLLTQVRAHRVAEMRKRRGLTQRQAAQAIGDGPAGQSD
jgi:hypothetical protein